MRHTIQKAGHEWLPVLFIFVGILSAILFYAGNALGARPPFLLVAGALVILALCTEWLTFTFLQDMQDAITYRRRRVVAISKALFTCAVSTFIFASATEGLWAPHTSLNAAPLAWAWVLAIGVFFSQFLLKLTPEQFGARRSVVDVAAAVEAWMPREASENEKMQATARVFSALAAQAQHPIIEAGYSGELPAVAGDVAEALKRRSLQSGKARAAHNGTS